MNPTFHMIANWGDIEKVNFIRLRQSPGYGYLFFGYAPHSLDQWEFQNGLYRWSL